MEGVLSWILRHLAPAASLEKYQGQTIDAIFRPVVLDPQQLLPSLEWGTRGQFLRLAAAFRRTTGLDLRVRSARRTCPEQDALYAIGRSFPGAIVTQASGCTSWHVLGRAVDADPVDPRTGQQTGREADYAAAGALWVQQGGVWGGHFPGFPDIGHFEWHPELRIETVCPEPSACDRIQVDTIGPSVWPWALVGITLAGTVGWVWLD